MNVVIIEDESRAARKLEQMILSIAPEFNIFIKLESVEEALEFFETKPKVDLIFSDIQLADGLSFEIYDKVTLDCPIIFTTAFDNYAIKAFKNNGVDYLLKPVNAEELEIAIDKVEKLKPKTSVEDILKIAATLNQTTKNYKSRFMVKIGDKINSISIEEITLFYSLEKSTFILTNEGRKYIVDYSLEYLEGLLNPKIFYRINRKNIISIKACKNIISYTNSRLKLQVENYQGEDIIVSRERVQAFKAWLDE